MVCRTSGGDRENSPITPNAIRSRPRSRSASGSPSGRAFMGGGGVSIASFTASSRIPFRSSRSVIALGVRLSRKFNCPTMRHAGHNVTELHQADEPMTEESRLLRSPMSVKTSDSKRLLAQRGRGSSGSCRLGRFRCAGGSRRSPRTPRHRRRDGPWHGRGVFPVAGAPTGFGHRRPLRRRRRVRRREYACAHRRLLGARSDRGQHGI